MKTITAFFAILILTFSSVSQTTVTYQQGVNGYTGCKSVNISDLNLVAGNNGTTFADGNNDWCIGKLHGRPGFGYDISPLLRFENLNIPANALVTAAVLTLTHVMWEVPSSRVKGRYLNVDWFGNVIDSVGGIGNAPIGWERRMPNTPWGSPGATGEGTDLIAGKYFFSPPDSSTIPSNGEVTYNIPLHLDEVQNWVTNPASNHGVILQVDAINVHVYYRPPQRPDVLKRPKLTITYTVPTGVTGSEIVPAEYFVKQNYPNPFNPETEISYGMPEDGSVKLAVFDALGNEIAVLVNEFTRAGIHSVKFNSDGLSSGVYFYRLTAGSFTETKKMSLIK